MLREQGEKQMTNKLKINPSYGFSSDGYSSLRFAPALEPVKDIVSYAISGNGPWGCRDGLGRSVREVIVNGSLPTDKTRMLFMWNATDGAKSWATRGINILHTCEKRAGWPLTKVQEVEMPDSSRYTLYCQSSRRWIKSSYLYTLYCLMMRMAADERITGFKNLEGLGKIIDSVKNNHKSFVRDHTYIIGTFPYWEALLVGYPDLFRQYKITYYWGLKNINAGDMSGSYGEGISKFCNGGTNWTDLYNKMITIKKKLDAEKK
jgi:hypothetical protein